MLALPTLEASQLWSSHCVQPGLAPQVMGRQAPSFPSTSHCVLAVLVLPAAAAF